MVCHYSLLILEIKLGRSMGDIYSISCTDITGSEISLEQYRGKVLLIVNVASKCGFTPQYAKLEQLYQKYKDQGLVVLAFPCNQFARQEPGDNAQICSLSESYKVSFPMFSKTEVFGDKACELYKYLRSNIVQKTFLPLIPLNFSKFVVDRQGVVQKRFLPWSSYSKLAQYIQSCL